MSGPGRLFDHAQVEAVPPEVYSWLTANHLDHAHGVVAELGVRSVEAFVQWGTFTVAYVLLMLVPCSALCLHLVLLPWG